MDPKISSSLASIVLISVTAALAGACKYEDAPLPGCFDSLKFRASFAASAVPIKD